MSVQQKNLHQLLVGKFINLKNFNLEPLKMVVILLGFFDTGYIWLVTLFSLDEKCIKCKEGSYTKC